MKKSLKAFRALAYAAILIFLGLAAVNFAQGDIMNMFAMLSAALWPIVAYLFAKRSWV